MTTTKISTSPKALPWVRYSEDVDRQIAAGLARETARGPRITVSNGTPSVGYGGERTYQTPRSTTQINGASDKQKDLIDKLLIERVHSYTEKQITEAKADWRLTRKMIDFLLDPTTPRRTVRVEVPVPVETSAPAPARARLDFSTILDGNYAIRVDGVVKFYRVSTGKSGYKNVQVRASDALYMQYGKAGIAILHRIVEAGLEESRMLFATELERCWKCGKSLTDETSRAIGMGPDCASK